MLPALVVASVGAASTLANPRGIWTWAPDAVTLSEAVATGNYAEVVRQIDNGVDPNPAADVRADLLAGHAMHLTPLQAAVRARSALMLRLLLDHGAVVGPSGLAVLKCLNEQDGNADVRAVLETLTTGPEPACADLTLPD